jgi:uncharacterized membrane protein
MNNTEARLESGTTTDDLRVRPDVPARVIQVELLISNLLRAGVILSLAFVILGTLITFIHHPDYLSSSRALSGLTGLSSTFPHTLPEVEHRALNLSGQALVILGLLLLIATPVMRVGISIAAFLYQRDRVFTLITFTVLCLLLLSFALGKAL